MFEVAIIGAGFGGIGMAIRLQNAGFDNFVLIEQADDIGGTWRDNRYPGCACDIPGQLYSFSFAPNAGWSHRYPAQPEIQDYLRDCVDRFNLRPHLRLGCGMRDAAFDADRSVWRVRLADGALIEARVLLVSVGALHRPAIPAIDGLQISPAPAFIPPVGTMPSISQASALRSSAPARARSSSSLRSPGRRRR